MENIIKEFRLYVQRTSDALAPIHDLTTEQLGKVEKQLVGYTKNLVEFAELITDKVNHLILENLPSGDFLKDMLFRERELALTDFEKRYKQ